MKKYLSVTNKKLNFQKKAISNQFKKELFYSLKLDILRDKCLQKLNISYRTNHLIFNILFYTLLVLITYSGIDGTILQLFYAKIFNNYYTQDNKKNIV